VHRAGDLVGDAQRRIALGSISTLIARRVPPTSVTEPTHRAHFPGAFERLLGPRCWNSTAPAPPFTAGQDRYRTRLNSAGLKRSTRLVPPVAKRRAQDGDFSRVSSAALAPVHIELELMIASPSGSRSCKRELIAHPAIAFTASSTSWSPPTR
jgi:hypothetical protein